MSESGPDWIVPDWPAPPNVRALVTTRAGGVSSGRYASMNLGTHVNDDAAAVAENRRRARRWLPDEPRWLNQVHGCRAVPAETVTQPIEADASYTRIPEVVCTVMVADCLPVLLCDRSGEAVAVAHAGWRGLAGGVLESTVAALGLPPSRLMAYLGPAIGPSAFEVGNDVRRAFVEADPDAGAAFRPRATGKWLADLFLLARQRLTRARIGAVYGGGLCTFTHSERFFSHRRDGVSGRMAAFIWLTR
jgi:polyphenol oxidase